MKRTAQISAFVVTTFFLMIGNVFGASFYDVPTSNTFYEYIQALSSDGIVSGYSDGSFRPEETVTRGTMAKFIRNGLELPASSWCSNFPDVSAMHTFSEDIQTLRCFGIISGYSDGNFYPDNPVTRGQAMKFIVAGARVKLGDWDYLNLHEDNFPDVPATSTFYEYITAASTAGIISGYSSGYFMPDENVSRGAMAKIVHNTRVEMGYALPVIPQSEIDSLLNELDGFNFDDLSF